MFDDPGKELKWLEDALLEPDDLPPEEQEDELDLEALLEERPAATRRPTRRPAARDFSRTVYDEPVDDSALVPDNDPKPKGIGGLVVLAFLELAGIVAVTLWWVKWVL